jgi:hypothetical protein
MPYDVVAYEADEKAMLLSPEQEGFFHRLLRKAWMNGSIPDDLDQLTILTRAISKSRFHKAWAEIQHLWVAHPSLPGRLINEKLEKERNFCKAKSVSAHDSAEFRWAKYRKNKEEDHANALRTQSERNASPPLPIPSSSSKKKERTKAAAPPLSPVLKFGEFQHVELSPVDLADLRTRLNGTLDGLITELDLYGENYPAKFRKYKNHKAVLLTWAGRREAKTFRPEPIVPRLEKPSEKLTPEEEAILKARHEAYKAQHEEYTAAARAEEENLREAQRAREEAYKAKHVP